MKNLILIYIVLFPLCGYTQTITEVLDSFDLLCNKLTLISTNDSKALDYTKKLSTLFKNVNNTKIPNFYEFQFTGNANSQSIGSFCNSLHNTYKSTFTTIDWPHIIIEKKRQVVTGKSDASFSYQSFNFTAHLNILFTKIPPKYNLNLRKRPCGYIATDPFSVGEPYRISLSLNIDCKDEKTCKIVSLINNSINEKDVDGDSFIKGGTGNSKDLCPFTFGTIKGCPDLDKDGFHEGVNKNDEFTLTEDECPNEFGKLKGCPDSDNDFINDQEDECPNQYGSLSANGCPDQDADGILDSLDLCEEIFGIPPHGCPDFDKDGLIDGEDSCPCLVGNRSTNGCPDSDGDGILDGLDNCNIFGTSADGCSERFKYKGRTEKVFTEKEAIIHLQIVDPYLIAATENGEFGIFNLDRFQNNPKRLPSLIEKEKKPFLIEDQYETFYVNNSKDIIIITSAKSKLESSEKKQYSKKKLTFPYLSFAPLNSDINNVIISADSAKSIIREANLSFAQTNFTELLNKLGEDITLEKEILVDNEVYRDIKDKNSYLLAIINNNLYLYKNHTVFYDDNYRKLFKLENQPQKLENRLNIKSGTFNNKTGELFIAGEDGVIYIYQKENVPLNSND